MFYQHCNNQVFMITKVHDSSFLYAISVLSGIQVIFWMCRDGIYWELAHPYIRVGYIYIYGYLC